MLADLLTNRLFRFFRLDELLTALSAFFQQSEMRIGRERKDSGMREIEDREILSSFHHSPVAQYLVIPIFP
jgi:hypothetical protein